MTDSTSKLRGFIVARDERAEFAELQKILSKANAARRSAALQAYFEASRQRARAFAERDIESCLDAAR